MVTVFVNLPVSWVVADEKWLPMFMSLSLNPEFGLDASSLELPAGTHREIASRIEDCGLFRSVHLPFWFLEPGSADPKKRAHARETLLRAAEIAEIYGAKHLVGHPVTQDEGAELDAPDEFKGRLERSAETWNAVHQALPVPLFLENTYERSPEPLASLMGTLGPDIKVCFDIGHWFHFGQGAARRNLEEWVSVLAPHIGHLHLHDNNGGADEHLGVGQGKIPFEEYFRLLKKYEVKPSLTLEPHTENDLEASFSWFRGHDVERNYLKTAMASLQ